MSPERSWWEELKSGSDEETSPDFPDDIVVTPKGNKPLDRVRPLRITSEQESKWTGKNPFSIPGELP